MTKILLLYKSRHQDDTYFSENVYGGIEKFARQIGEVLDDIIPIVVSPDERKGRLTRTIIETALSNHDPDVVITNDIDNLYTNHVVKQGYPLISIIHEGCVGDVRYLEMGARIKEMHELGAHVYFVSKRQFKFHSDMCNRLNGYPLPDPTGYIPSSYCSDNLIYANDVEYDAGTIGRTDPVKNPFLLHKKLEGSKYTSLVITDSFQGTKKNGSTEKYRDANSNWALPRETFRDLSHTKTMEKLSHMGCYVSTCPLESWGITALEALGTGIPLILLTDKTGEHSSEDIPVSKDHYFKLPKSCSKEDFYDVIDQANKIENRIEIADLTREYHSKARWKEMFEKIIDRRLDDKIKKSASIEDFF